MDDKQPTLHLAVVWAFLVAAAVVGAYSLLRLLLGFEAWSSSVLVAGPPALIAMIYADEKKSSKDFLITCLIWSAAVGAALSFWHWGLILIGAPVAIFAALGAGDTETFSYSVRDRFLLVLIFMLAGGLVAAMRLLPYWAGPGLAVAYLLLALSAFLFPIALAARASLRDDLD